MEILPFSRLRLLLVEAVTGWPRLFLLLLLWSDGSLLGASALGLLLWAIGVVLFDESQILLNTLHFLYEASLLLQLLLGLHELLLLGRQLLAQLLVLGDELKRRKEVGVVLLVLSLLLA